MIPALIDLGSPTPWPVLPPGMYDTTLEEVADRFATTPHRRRLFDGFGAAVTELARVGCGTLYIDGSFTTDKPHPSDFDGCWEIHGVDPTRLDPVLLDFTGMREAQKRKYLGEMFIAELPGAPGLTFLQLFQREKYSGRPKGILRLTFPPARGPGQ